MEGDAIMLDAGALAALAHGNKTLRNAIKKDLTIGSNVFVSSAVLAQALTGDARRDVRINATLKRVLILGVDEPIARIAGMLRHKNRERNDDPVDAIVVATADTLPGARLFTTKPALLEPLAAIRRRCFIFGV